MSMFNILFGQADDADRLFQVLNLTRGDVGRYRDIYLDLEEGYPRIIVYTRNGGGNREYFEEVFDKLSQHPWYETDWDDNFDCTYAYISFRIPQESVDLIEGMEQGVDPKKMWEALFESLNKGSN